MTRINTHVLCFFFCFVLFFVPVRAQDTAEVKPRKKTKAAAWFSRTFAFLKKKQPNYENATVAQDYLWQRAKQEPIAFLGYAAFLPYEHTPRTLAALDDGEGGGVLEDPEEIAAQMATPAQIATLTMRSRESFLGDTWMQEYELIKDSKKVNPYGMDWKSFDDTVNMTLSAPEHFLPWKPPLDYMVVTSDFGMRRYRWHYGVDIRLNWGDAVRNMSYGVVRLAQYQRRGFGHYIVVSHHNGLETIYAHLSKRLVKPGDIVQAGDILGLGGSSGRSSGPHLHFEIRYKGWPIDPNALIDFPQSRLHASNYALTKEIFNYLKKATAVLTHRIRRGDNLTRIARRYRTTVSKLCRLNKINRRTILRIGRKLRIR